MKKLKMTSIVMVSTVIVSCSFVSSVFAELPQKFIDSTNAIIDTLRKRECVLKITNQDKTVSSKAIKVKQIRNDFGFGASIGQKWFDADSIKYGNAFRTYFEWATPENEMKWPFNEAADDYQDFEIADTLISWCQKHDIKVRGHNLFWNERREWMPSWALELSPANFKLAIQRRIDGTIAHFKGKVAHWDLINEIVHYKEADNKTQIKKPGLLAQLSGDDKIFSWIFHRADSIDSDVVMTVNEYSVIEKIAHTKEYIEEIKDIEANGGKVDVIGLEGHFDDYVVRESYMNRIDTIAQSLPHQMWLTEVDFTLEGTYAERADKMEELMRSAFAYPRIGGFVLWAWWEGNQWKEKLSSFLVDSSYNETEIGSRWRALRNSWRTDTSGVTSADGEFTFKGFHGKYEISVQFEDSLYCDTFYLEPGQGKKSGAIDLTFSVNTRPNEKTYDNGDRVTFGGKSISIPKSINTHELFLLTYTLSGRLINKQTVSIRNGIISHAVTLPQGMYLIKLATREQTVYSGIQCKM